MARWLFFPNANSVSAAELLDVLAADEIANADSQDYVQDLATVKKGMCMRKSARTACAKQALPGGNFCRIHSCSAGGCGNSKSHRAHLCEDHFNEQQRSQRSSSMSIVDEDAIYGTADDASFLAEFNKMDMSIPPRMNSAGDEPSIFTDDGLKEATKNFSPDNLLSSGSEGFTYRGFEKQALGGCAVAVTLFDAHVQLKKTTDTFFSNALHPNILQVYGTGQVNSSSGMRRCVVSKLMPGGNMLTLLQQSSRPFGWKNRLKAVHDALRALTFLKSRSTSTNHNIKSRNILLEKDLNTAVLHVLSLIVEEDGAADVFYHPEDRAYASPAARRGEEDDTRDIYAMGVVLLEILTGKPPCVEGFALDLVDKLRKPLDEYSDDMPGKFAARCYFVVACRIA